MNTDALTRTVDDDQVVRPRPLDLRDSFWEVVRLMQTDSRVFARRTVVHVDDDVVLEAALA